MLAMKKRPPILCIILASHVAPCLLSASALAVGFGHGLRVPGLQETKASGACIRNAGSVCSRGAYSAYSGQVYTRVRMYIYIYNIHVHVHIHLHVHIHVHVHVHVQHVHVHVHRYIHIHMHIHIYLLFIILACSLGVLEFGRAV